MGVDLATTPPPPTKEPMRGVIRRGAGELGAPITVEVLAFSDVYVFEVDRYEYRGLTIPLAGDECIVIEDERGEPWVPVWWPAAGDTPIEPGGGELDEWLTGAGVPSAELGHNGDLYLRTSNGAVYEKAGGVWGLLLNITGPTGATGATGAKGETGATGPEGPKGEGGDNRGIVEALPSTSLVKGETECWFKVSAANYWHLGYTEEATYPWAFLGGSAIYEHVEATANRSAATYGDLTGSSGPSITLPLKGEYEISFGCETGISHIGERWMSVELHGVAASDEDSIRVVNPSGQAAGGLSRVLNAKTFTEAGKKVVAKYKSDSTGERDFVHRWVRAVPFRVG